MNCTREFAVTLAIESILLRSDISEVKRNKAICILEKMLKTERYNEWNQEKIVKKLKEFKDQNGRAPTVTDLSKYGMPKPLTIKTYFSMSPSLFLKQLFPENRIKKPKHDSNPYGFVSKDDWLNCFKEQFIKHKHEGLNSKTYNKLKDNGTPPWTTICSRCNLSGWTKLMEAANVTYPDKLHKTCTTLSIGEIKAPITTIIEEYNNVIKERERQFEDFFTEYERRERKQSELLDKYLGNHVVLELP